MPTLTPKARSLLWKTPQGFALSHCMNCALSWTRGGKEGGDLVICLLDREPVLDDMVRCSRFEVQPDKIGGPSAPSLLSAEPTPTEATISAPPETTPAPSEADCNHCEPKDET
jgi:hypothetical protein